MGEPSSYWRVLSFSTCWNSARHTSGGELAAEILEMGFRRIELGHGLRAPLVAQLLEAQQESGFEVGSVHCFCPLPPEVLADNPDCYEFTSHREDDRRRATRLAIQTIDMAARFGASTVVVHAGRIRTLAATDRLRDTAARHGLLGKAYARAKVAAVIRRERLGGRYLQRSLDCLVRIAEHAANAGIRLGIENRDDYEAVPSETEFPDLLARLGAPHVGYWHDFGHAQIKDHLGLLSHAQWLDRAGSLAVGCHVHDVVWPFADHRAPFTGTVDFATLVPKLPKGIDFVFEISPRVSRGEILAAADRWKSQFES